MRRRRRNVPTLRWRDVNSMIRCMFVCSRAHQSCFNTRSQTLKTWTTRPKTTKLFVFFSSSALPSRLHADLRQLGAPQWMFPHRHYVEMSLIWMYLLYFNMGSLNETMTLKLRDFTDCSIQITSEVWSGATVNVRLLSEVRRSHFMNWCIYNTAQWKQHGASRKNVQKSPKSADKNTKIFSSDNKWQAC